ncbi:phage holin family protein [Carboxylicivirga sp. N1Y90]|uniref:phage holin family protein n=1 Tax=Carboxylicivirga fragile TaxID=3417571 RepID=UPI003D3493FC|nr:phage holin family protein [Marinilabiliaceae bacterium N1Y90]
MKDRLSDEVKEVKDDFEEYVKAQVDLIKLHSAQSISQFLSGFIVKTVLFYLMFFALLFLSMAVALWLGRVLDSNELGFVIVAGFYMLCGLLFLSVRKKLIEKPIIKSVIELFFPNYQNYDESIKK